MQDLCLMLELTPSPLLTWLSYSLDVLLTTDSDKSAEYFKVTILQLVSDALGVSWLMPTP